MICVLTVLVSMTPPPPSLSDRDGICYFLRNTGENTHDTQPPLPNPLNPEKQGYDLALIVVYVQYSLDSGGTDISGISCSYVVPVNK
jgi:hypothetical protein